MNAFDYENKSNCWNSEGSSDGNKECFFVVDFGRKVKVVELRIQFQAGFSAELMTVLKQKSIDKRYEAFSPDATKQLKQCCEARLHDNLHQRQNSCAHISTGPQTSAPPQMFFSKSF